MSTQTDKLKKIIEAMVRAEVRAVVPHLVKEVVAGLIMESTPAYPEPHQYYPQSAPPRQQVNNSHKRIQMQQPYALQEGYEEYPTMPAAAIAAGRPSVDRSRMASMMGYGDVGGHAGGALNEMIVSTALTENGTAIPVDPNTLPPEVVHALSRNYTDVMKALKLTK